MGLLRGSSGRTKQYRVAAKSIVSPHSLLLSFSVLLCPTSVPWIYSSVNTLPQLLLSGGTERSSDWLSETYYSVSGCRGVQPLKVTWKDIFLLPQTCPSKSAVLLLTFPLSSQPLPLKPWLTEGREEVGKSPRLD